LPGSKVDASGLFQASFPRPPNQDSSRVDKTTGYKASAYIPVHTDKTSGADSEARCSREQKCQVDSAYNLINLCSVNVTSPAAGFFSRNFTKHRGIHQATQTLAAALRSLEP
jgi:hypothetical protein